MQEQVDPAANVVLRSSDGQMFYPRKEFLSMSSPVFAAMFALPQPADSDEQQDGLPVIDVTEDGRTLESVLSLCQPSSLTGKQFKADSILQLRDVIDATVKYDMENARRAVLEELTNPLIVNDDPMYAFVLACQYEMREAAQLAAKHTLYLPSLIDMAYMPELEKFHAGKLWHLFWYREKCVSAASSLAFDHTWIVPVCTNAILLFGCSGEGMEQIRIRHPPSRKYSSGRLENTSVHRWWIEYMRKSESALKRRPRGDEVRSPRLVDEVLRAISTSTCEECQASHVLEAFQNFVNTFAETIERRVAEVEIPEF